MSEYWIGLSYLFYGVEVTVFAFALTYLRQLGTREIVVGAFSSTTDIPVLFRVAIGVLTDSYDFKGLGHRRPAVGFGLALSCVSFILIALLVVGGGFQLWSFILLYFISAMGKELSQGTLDAYANEISPREKAGRMQGVVIGANRVIGLFLGLGIGSYATSAKTDTSYFLMFLFTGIVCVFPTVLTFWTKEPPVLSVFNWRQPIEAFKRTNMLALGCFISVGGFLMSSNTLAFTGYLDDNGIDGTLFASYFLVFNIFFLVGSILAAKVFDGNRSRLPWVFTAFISLTIVSQFVFIVAELTDTPQLLYFFLILLSTFGSALVVLAYSLTMLLIKDPISSGSIFAALHIFQAIGSVLAGVISGAILDVSSYSVNCVINIVVLAIGLPLAFIASRNIPQYSNNVTDTEMCEDVKDGSVSHPRKEESQEADEREADVGEADEQGLEEAGSGDGIVEEQEAVHVENVNGVQHIQLANATAM